MGSPRLRIEPARHEWLEALVEGDSVFESRFGVDVSPGWSGFPEALPHMRDAARRSPLDPWGTHLLFDEATGTPTTLIGVGGWKGSPSERGEAELGYAVATGYQGRCVATAFVRELIASGRVAGVATAVAHTMPSESASTGVLRRCGFRNVATVASGSDAGTESSVWRWERWLTDRLTIEPLAVEHAPELFAALDDARVGNFIGGADVTTIDALLIRIQRLQVGAPPDSGESWLNWAVWLDESAGDATRTVIGRIEATVHRARAGQPITAEVAYVFGPAWWGDGYATEATRWMIDHLGREHDVAEVWATVDPRNEASIKLLRRLGFEATPLPDGGLGSYDDGDLVFVRGLSAS